MPKVQENSVWREKVLIKECFCPMESLSEEDFILEPKYFEWGFSDTPDIKLRKSVIELLRKAKLELPSGWNFKVWDGFRTLKTQKLIYQNYWDILKKENPSWSDSEIRKHVEVFVAPASYDKAIPSPHNTGGTVDLTLVDENKNEIDMGTKFDEFREASFSDYFAGAVTGSREEFWHKNRVILLSAMEKVGFVGFEDEWWHFSYGTPQWASAKNMERHNVDTVAIFASVEL